MVVPVLEIESVMPSVTLPNPENVKLRAAAPDPPVPLKSPKSLSPAWKHSEGVNGPVITWPLVTTCVVPQTSAALAPPDRSVSAAVAASAPRAISDLRMLVFLARLGRTAPPPESPLAQE